MNFFKSSRDAMNLSQDPESFFKEKYKKWGATFPVYLPAAPRTFFTSNANGARQIFTAPPRLFSPSPMNPISPLVGENSLILLGSQRHNKEKKSLLPFFLGKSIQANQTRISDLIEEELIIIKSKDQAETYLLDMIQNITLHIIISIVFGIKKRDKRLAFKFFIQEYIKGYGPSLMFFPRLRTSAYPPWKNFKKKKLQFDKEIISLIHKPSEEDSIIEKLKILYAEEIKANNYDSIIDQLKTILIAGHETTAITLFWSFYYLNQDKELLNSTRNEIKEMELNEIMQNKNLEAICNESMRMHPSVPIILRTLTEDFTFQNKEMKKGENIGISLTLLHRDPEIFNTPNDFAPERFLNNIYDQSQFAPFGGSNRKCIGSSFAMAEMKIFISSILKHTNIDFAQNIKVKAVIKGITMCPNKDIKITL